MLIVLDDHFGISLSISVNIRVSIKSCNIVSLLIPDLRIFSEFGIRIKIWSTNVVVMTLFSNMTCIYYIELSAILPLLYVLLSYDDQ